MRKVVSLFIAILGAGVAYHFPYSLLALPAVGFLISIRMTDDDCTYHQLISGMNRDLLFLYPIMVAVVGVALLIKDTRQLPTTAVLFVLIYYYCAYISNLRALYWHGFWRSAYTIVVSAAVLLAGFASWVAVDYAASLLGKHGWAASDQRDKTHIVSSILIYVSLVPISGMLGAQMSLLLTAFVRRLAGK